MGVGSLPDGNLYLFPRTDRTHDALSCRKRKTLWRPHCGNFLSVPRSNLSKGKGR